MPVEMLRILVIPQICEYSRGTVFGENLRGDRPYDTKQVREQWLGGRIEQRRDVHLWDDDNVHIAEERPRVVVGENVFVFVDDINFETTV